MAYVLVHLNSLTELGPDLDETSDFLQQAGERAAELEYEVQCTHYGKIVYLIWFALRYVFECVLHGSLDCEYFLLLCFGLTINVFAYCISPNVGRYFGLVTGPPPPPAMEAMQAMEAAAMAAAAATERF